MKKCPSCGYEGEENSCPTCFEPLESVCEECDEAESGCVCAEEENSEEEN
ncbi:MAG: hypothetical protein Q8M83_06760 [bacterium]|nr:hypothetical protein [bacterium]